METQPLIKITSSVSVNPAMVAMATCFPWRLAGGDSIAYVVEIVLNTNPRKEITVRVDTEEEAERIMSLLSYS